MFERILVPLDGSRFSELAVPLATGLASRYDASGSVADKVARGADMPVLLQRTADERTEDGRDR